MFKIKSRTWRRLLLGCSWMGAAILCAPAWLWLSRRWIDGQYLPGVLALGLIVWEFQRVRRSGDEGGAGRDRGGARPNRPRAWIGPALVGTGALLAWTANILESSVLLGWCFPLMAGGLVLEATGLRQDRKFVPLFFYSLLVFPLPGLVSAHLSLPIRLAAGRIAALLLNLLGVACTSRGVVVETLRYHNTVVPACGGEEVIHLFLVLGVALAYLQQEHRTNARFWLQAVGTAPAALLANGCRIALLTFIGHRWGEAAAAGFFHDFSGLMVFAVFLVLMILIGEGLRPRRRHTATTAPAPESAGSELAVAPSRPVGAGTLLLQNTLIAAVILLSAQAWWNARNTVWGRNLSGLIPSDMPGWRWESLLLTLSEESYLSRNFVVKRVYRRHGRQVVLFAVTGAEGRRQAYHSPEICYRGDGWKILVSRSGGQAAPNRPGGRPIPYHLLIAQRGTSTATTIFWLDNGRERTARLAVKDWGEVMTRLGHVFRRYDRWALVAVTSLDPDRARALRDCLALARDLP